MERFFSGDHGLIDFTSTQPLRNTLLKLGSKDFNSYIIPFVIVYILTVLAYSYLFTTIIFTNHTLPNSWIYNYPSFKTRFEGRWFADILIQLTGGSGVQSLQLFVGAAIQIINGFLFAAFLRLKKMLYITLAAAFLALHPAFLDYYSFTVDDVSFTIADTFALLGVISLATLHGFWRIIAPIIFFVLTLATYPPKIALIGILLLIWCLDFLTLKCPQPQRRYAPLIQVAVERFMPALLAFVGGLAVYYITIKLTIVQGDDRNHINGIAQVWSQLLVSYADVWGRVFSKVDYLNKGFRFLPLISVIFGVACIIYNVHRANRSLLPLALVLIALFPVTLQASYLINDNTWKNAGRILSPEAYALLFFATRMWLHSRVRLLSTLLIGLMIWQFLVLGSQRVNEAAMKTIFDRAKINRIIKRIEDVVPDLYHGKRPIVIFGSIAFDTSPPFRSAPGSAYGAQILTESFISYRQVEIINFFLGRQVVRKPTQAEFDAVIADPRTRGTWPAPDSVYLDKGTIVVLLGPRSRDNIHTWVQ